MPRKTISLLFCLLVPQAAHALAISGFNSFTAPTNKTIARISFSGAFSIDGVEYEKNSPLPVFPLSKTNNGHAYANIRVLDKNLLTLLSSEKKPQTSYKNFKKPVARLFSLRRLDSPTRVANADITFDGQLSVTFGLLKISRKKRGSAERTSYFRLAEPPDFMFESDELREEVRNLIIAAATKEGL